MTDRYHALTVVLTEDTRDDACKPMIDAIMLFKGVVSVTGQVADSVSHMAEERARTSIGKRLLEICYPSRHPKSA